MDVLEIDHGVVDVIHVFERSDPPCDLVALCREVEHLPSIAGQFDHRLDDDLCLLVVRVRQRFV